MPTFVLEHRFSKNCWEGPKNFKTPNTNIFILQCVQILILFKYHA